MEMYIVKVVGQSLYITQDETITPIKSRAYATDYEKADKIINKLNRNNAINGIETRYEMTYK